jgi:hypothetical protein
VSNRTSGSEGPHEDVSGEKFGHIPARPVSWVVVFLVCAGFLVGGIGLIAATQWLFWLGIGIVAAGTILGWVTHAMADLALRAERSTRARRAKESADGEVATF